MIVTVVGAGIIGTTTAFRLKRRFPDLKVQIVADKFSPNTTSDIAAGWWEPSYDPDTPAELVADWAGQTYNLLLSLWRSQPDEEIEDIWHLLKEGLSMMSMTCVTSDPSSLDKPWASQVLSYSSTREASSLCDVGFTRSEDMLSFSFLSFTLEPSIVLPVFYDWLKKQGVQFIEKKLDSLDELFERDEEDVVVNCSGLGARELASDEAMYPLSGHVLRAKIPTMKQVLVDERPQSRAYIIPNRDSVVLGAVNRPGNWNTQVNPEETQQILNNCKNICPAVLGSEIVSDKVGLRPCRRGGVNLGLRLHKRGKIIDNYGHGGSGITLSWGCAKHVADILQSIIASDKEDDRQDDRKPASN